jgi:hypothetical protein
MSDLITAYRQSVRAVQKHKNTLEDQQESMDMLSSKNASLFSKLLDAGHLYVLDTCLLHSSHVRRFASLTLIYSPG